MSNLPLIDAYWTVLAWFLTDRKRDEALAFLDATPEEQANKEAEAYAAALGHTVESLQAMQRQAQQEVTPRAGK